MKNVIPCPGSEASELESCSHQEAESNKAEFHPVKDNAFLCKNSSLCWAGCYVSDPHRAYDPRGPRSTPRLAYDDVPTQSKPPIAAAVVDPTWKEAGSACQMPPSNLREEWKLGWRRGWLIRRKQRWPSPVTSIAGGSASMPVSLDDPLRSDWLHTHLRYKKQIFLGFGESKRILTEVLPRVDWNSGRVYVWSENREDGKD